VPAMLTSMPGRIIRVYLAVVLAALVALTALPGPASAQDTSNDERIVVLVDPGVLFVDTSVKVFVRLSYSDYDQYSGQSTISMTYRFNYGSGSGFVVNPNGLIITAAHVVDPSRQTVRNYAANKLFKDGGILDERANPFTQHTLPDPELSSLLEQCYDGVSCHFDIKRTVRVYTPVQIAGVSAPKPLSARVLKSTGADNTDVAVLQVDGSNMPTVPLATTADDLKSGQSIVAAGFPGSAADLPSGFTEPVKLFGRVSNVRSDGTTKVVEASIANLSHGMSGGPGVNSDGKVVGLISTTRLDPADGSPTQIYLRTVDDIRAALRAAGGVQAARGEVDNLFSQAMDYFWNHHYSAALPLYQKVLNLYDGHPQAKKYLAEAQAKANTADDLPLSTGRSDDGRSRLLTLGVPALVVAIVALIALVLFRRRRAAAKARPPVPTVHLSGNGRPDDLRPAAGDGQGLRTIPAGGADALGQPDEGQRIELWEEPTPSSVAVATEEDEPSQLASSTTRFCTRCGNHLDEDDRFCGACGQPAR
jgi:S1-C subfamily serine protease